MPDAHPCLQRPLSRLLSLLFLLTAATAQTPSTSHNVDPIAAASPHFVVPSWNWAYTDSDQAPLGSLDTPGKAHVITLPCSPDHPCPAGIDTAATTHHYIYSVYISGRGKPEAVPVTGGTCSPKATSKCTLILNTANPHPAGYTIGSASSGIQEAWNDAWVNDSGGAPNASSLTGPYVKLAAGQQYNVYATVYLRGRGGVLDGNGALLACSTRDRCIFVGTRAAYPAVDDHKLYSLSGTSTVSSAGVNVQSISASAGTYTITVPSGQTIPFQTLSAQGVADTVACEVHSNTSEQMFVAPVTSVSGHQFTVRFGNATYSAAPYTFGFCNLLNAFLENDSDHVTLDDLNLFQSNPAGMGWFSYGVVNDNDQQFIIERATNRGSCAINPCPGSDGANASTWPIGAFFYQRNDQGMAGIMYIHNSEISNVNCYTGGNNGMVFSDSVCQAVPFAGVRYFGGLQPATLANIYNEQGGGIVNPLYGYGAAVGYILGGGSAGGGSRFLGNFPLSGQSPTFAVTGGTGACTPENYFVVAHEGSQGAYPAGPSGVMFIGQSPATNCGGGTVTIVWPSLRLQDSAGQSTGAITWDVLKTMGTSNQAPYGANGTGNYYVVAANISGNCTVTGMCSTTATIGATPATSYTVAKALFGVQFWFWPTTFALNTCPLTMDATATNPSTVSVCASNAVSIIASRMASAGPAAQRTPIWTDALDTDPGNATLLQQISTAGNSPPANSKGRINLGSPLTNLPTDLITLGDANFNKTTATAGGRPSNDTGDCAIGLDSSSGMSLRCANDVTVTIGARPNGSNSQLKVSPNTLTASVPLRSTGTECGPAWIHLEGWGAGSSTTKFSGYSQTCQFTITTGAAPFHASPTVAVVFPDAKAFPAAPICTLDVHAITGPSGAIMFDNTQPSTTAPAFTASTNSGTPFTPAPSETFKVVLRCGP